MLSSLVRVSLLPFVKKVVDECDPQGLLKIGAPANEYDNESAMIAAQLFLTSSEEELLTIIYSVFVVQFTLHLAGKKEGYRVLAHTLWNGIHCKNCGSFISDPENGFCQSDNDSCWEEWSRK